MSSGEHPLLACQCVLCHTWRRVGFLLVAPARSDAFRGQALRHIRELYAELLDLAEGVGVGPPVAEGVPTPGSGAAEHPPGVEGGGALAQATSKAPPVVPPALATAGVPVAAVAEASGADQSGSPAKREQEKEQQKEEIESPGKAVEQQEKVKKKKKSKRRRSHRDKDRKSPEVCKSSAVKGESSDFVPDYEDDQETAVSPQGRRPSPSLRRKEQSPERRRIKEESPAKGGKEERNRADKRREISPYQSPESGRVESRGEAPEKRREREREKKRSRSRRAHRERTPERRSKRSRSRKRRTPSCWGRNSPSRRPREEPGSAGERAVPSHRRDIPPPEPSQPPRLKAPTRPPPGIFGGPFPYWHGSYGWTPKSKGVKRRERNEDIRRHGLDEERKHLRQSRGG